MKKPAAKSLSKQSSGERQPYLVLFYRPSGKCAIRQNYGGAKKQLFQFGGKDFDENDLRNIAKTAIANIINNTLDETCVRQFVDDEVSKLVRDVDWSVTKPRWKHMLLNMCFDLIDWLGDGSKWK